MIRLLILAVGDLPDMLEADLKHHGISIAVELDQQLAACDCRTGKRPCIHILATIYTLSSSLMNAPRWPSNCARRAQKSPFGQVPAGSS